MDDLIDRLATTTEKIDGIQVADHAGRLIRISHEGTPETVTDESLGTKAFARRRLFDMAGHLLGLPNQLDAGPTAWAIRVGWTRNFR
jgi:hypothetical protein